MSETASGTLEREGVQAFVQMEEALRLLDTCDEAIHVGAQLDLAICRLGEVLAQAGIDTPPRRASPDSP